MNTVLIQTEQFNTEIKSNLGASEITIDSYNPDIKANERKMFTDAMADAVNGVQVITTDGRAGQYGLTINTLTSVSADPPMVLVCINRNSPVRDAIQKNGVFCVNLLSIKQSKVAQNFSGRPRWGKPYDFSREKWVEGMTGSPTLGKALANFDCYVERCVDAGSHTIFIGSVVETVARNGAPLLYTKRTYGFPYLLGL